MKKMKKISQTEYEDWLSHKERHKRSEEFNRSTIARMDEGIKYFREQNREARNQLQSLGAQESELKALREYKARMTEVIEDLNTARRVINTLKPQLEDQAALKVQLEQTGRDLRAARRARDNAKAGFTRLNRKLDNLRHELWELSGGERGKEHPGIKAAEMALIESDLPDE